MTTLSPRLAPLDRHAVPELETLFDRAEQKSGHVANAFLIMARRPALLELIYATRETIYKESSVDRTIFDLIGMMVSIMGGCEYSQGHGKNRMAAHGSLGADKAAAIMDFETSPLFTDAERAALRVARGSSTTPNSITDEDFAELRRHFSEESIVDIVARACNTAWMNRWNTTMRTPLE